MNFLLRFLLSDFNLDDVTYVGIAALLGIGFLLLLSYILFIVIVAFKEVKEDTDFERALIRKGVWAWIYVFNCFWLSAEIIACWQFNWLRGLKFYIPLWIVFIFSAIMAITMGYPYKRRAAQLRTLNVKTQNFKE